jgi:uncharacterized membrane protein YbhN (UPF0104 family)
MGGARLMPIGWRRWTTVGTGLIILAAAYLVVAALRQFTLDEVVQSLRGVSAGRLGLAALYAGASYITLTGFDLLGVRYAGRKLAYRRIALASFVSLSIGHTVGLAPLSSGAIRYRFYSRWGLGIAEIGLIIVFSAVTVGLGEAAVAATALLLRQEDAARVLELSPFATTLIGAGCAAAVATYLLLAVFLRRPFHVFGRRLRLPDWRMALAQIAIGTLNYTFVTAALQQAVGPDRIDYGTTATAYVLGSLAALLSHIPGGLGVLEAVIVTLLPHADVIGGLVAFRALYYFAPLSLGVLLFAASEITQSIRRRRGHGAKARTSGRRAVAQPGGAEGRATRCHASGEPARHPARPETGASSPTRSTPRARG